MESERTGVYMLSGPDPEDSLKERIYIGEGDRVIERLKAHDKDDSKEFWTRVVFAISKDENLTKAHGRYLESRLIGLAKRADRAILHNSDSPSPPPLPESDQADMEYFLEQIEIVFPVLGFSCLQPKPEQLVSQQTTSCVGSDELMTSSPLFVIDRPSQKVYAEARLVNGEMVVLGNAKVRRQGTPSWDSYLKLRDKLIAEGKIRDTDDPEVLVFKENISFSSPSAAAAVVLARNANGRTEWALKGTSTTYGDWQDKRLDSDEAVE